MIWWVMRSSQFERRPTTVLTAVHKGWNDLGYQSSANGSDVRSPKIDALAASGIKLRDYNVFRFCSPTRSTFQTGRHPYHLGQQTGMNLNPMPGIACGVNLEYDFAPKMLQRAGYKSYMLGKWHQGFYNRSQTPTHRGYSEFLGYYSGAEEHFTHEKAGEGHSFFDLANNTGENGPITNADASAVGPNGTYSVYLYGNESVRIIQQHDTRSPLFLFLSWNVVHAPCEAPAGERHSNYTITHSNYTMTHSNYTINTLLHAL
jgi:arylsulfatase A-like enzyme